MEVRRLTAGEGGRIRDLRLRALQEAPYAFSSSLERERDRAAEDWEELARGVIVFVAVENDQWLGMVGAYVPADAPEAVAIWGTWVDPEARGRGLGRLLMDAAIEWARDRGAARVDLSVTDQAAAAYALYLRLGFVPTGERQPLASDPTRVEIFMRRPL
jgi:ribosomal protein S18 acetylase RimI-like enzyme